MWEIQILWAGWWVTVQTDFETRGDAEWATAQRKQKNQCIGDPFRAVKSAKGEIDWSRPVQLTGFEIEALCDADD